MKTERIIIRVEISMREKLEKLAKDSKREFSDYLRLVLQNVIDKKLKI